MSSLLASTVHWPHFNEIRKTIKNCSQNMVCRFGTTCCLYNQRSVSNKKVVLPAFQLSDLIYQFSCHSNSWYVGRTSQRLQDRIRQHIHKTIRNAAACSHTRSQPKRDCKSSTQQVPITQSLSCDSAIGLHLQYYEIPSAHKITMTNNFLFLSKPALPSIYLSLKPFSLKP